MDGASWRWAFLAGSAWSGAALVHLPVAPPPELCAAGSVAALAWALARTRAARSVALPACVSVALAFTILATPRAAVPAAGTSRVRAVVTDVEPRPEALRLGIESAADALASLDVRRTGDPSLDAQLALLRPGARVGGPVEPRESGRSARVAAAAVLEVRAAVPGEGGVRLRFARLRAAFRERAVARLAREDAAPGAVGIAIALLTGLRGWLPAELTAAIRRSGLAHLFVVSGMHVGWVVLGLTLLVRRAAGRESRAAGSAQVAAVVLAAALLPLTPPVRRAVGVVAFARGAAMAGRRMPGLVALSCAAALALAASPELARSWSFGLTVSASAALVLAARRQRGPSRALALVGAPAAATWPLVVAMTGRVAPWGAAATPFALPPTAAALAAAWLAVLLPDGVPGAETAVRAALTGAAWLEQLVASVAALPASGRIAAPCGVAWVTLTLVALGSSLTAPGRRSRRIAGAVLLAACAWPLRPLAGPATAAEARILDVGQGQAVLLRVGRRAVLVDAADDRPWHGTRAVLTRLRALRVGRLDALVLTHADRDHAGGAREVLAATRVALLVLPGRGPAREFRAIVRDAAVRGIPVLPLVAGETIVAGGLRLDAWHPRAHEPLEGNEASLVLRVTMPGLALVLPGDAGRAAEHALLARTDVRPAPFLVAGHHGSATATGVPLLGRLRPRALLVSSGPFARFGHPHPATLERARRAGVRPLVTAYGGEIVVTLVRGRPVAIQPR